ncbi:iron complex transport system substrate-binding protein [Trinickia symbiotica]|uniref:Cobalamin-binding protein n=1 Tax=Trinickia symbiotica TaxID=863227 RepID=A0A2N7X2Z4_9BURK|nr:cobalamin-binding protein [Trinickia symbiotica]PMS36128.1 cobalamin-binding protein [Trinickia symbiotica]PPK45821.1 iron complex transport system substrate-binding protein [Trinickia symbiotica]
MKPSLRRRTALPARASVRTISTRLTATLALGASLAAHAALTVTDDTGGTVTLAAPAQRVIALAPHTVELVYAAGGGPKLVGAVSYSDYPPAAKALPRVGSNTALDLERIVALKPDLIVVWRHGNDERQLAKLRALGIAIFRSEPQKVDDVATDLEKLGVLLGSEPTADTAAREYREKTAKLRVQYADRPPVNVFYQVWSRPLMTLNGTHIVSDAIALCGGRNVFADLAPLVPTVSTEAVIAANPEAIVTADPVAATTQTGASEGFAAGASTSPAASGAPREDRLEASAPEFAMWRAWPRLEAVARGNLFVLDADLIDRPGPRFALGAAALCRDLDIARSRRPK